MKRIGSLLSVAIAAFAFGQTGHTVEVSFANEGEREVWIGPTSNPGDYVSPQSAQGKSISLETPDKADGLSIYVHDKTTGNVVSKPLADAVKDSVWKVDPKLATRVRALEFMVTSDGKPVASAVVKAKAGSETRQALITPGDKGRAVLYNLLPGNVQVTIDYKVGAASKSMPSQSFDAKLGAGPPKPKSIVITDKVETVSDSAAPNTQANQPSTDSTKPDIPKGELPAAPNPAASFLNLILGLAVIAAIGYGIFTYVKKNPKQFEDSLKKVGLAQVEPVADTTPAPPAQPQPIKPIVLDDSAPTNAVASIPIAGGTLVKNPRLVKSDGSVVLLNEGSNIVGRDTGLPISLAGESSVSRQHARLDKSGDSVTVTDLGSTNGTFVNGSRLTGDKVLQFGDSVQFGAIAFRYEE